MTGLSRAQTTRLIGPLRGHGPRADGEWPSPSHPHPLQADIELLAQVDEAHENDVTGEFCTSGKA